MDRPGPGDTLGPRSSALQHLRRLSGRRRARSEHGQFVIDGPTLLTEAMASPVEIVEVYAEPGAPEDLRDRLRASRIAVREVAPGALAKVTSPATPQPIAALATVPPPASLSGAAGLVLVLLGVADPGNAGTLFRIAEAAGASALVSCADAVDVWNPKCVRASAGSLFRVPFVPGGDPSACLSGLRESGMTVLATAAGRGRPHDVSDLTGDVAILLGNEAHGLPAEIVDSADGIITVPMAGSVESLNVAMTGAVIAFESARQRRARPMEADPSN